MEQKFTKRDLSRKSHSMKGNNMAELVEVKSPCVGNCFQNTALGLCIGCYRTSIEKLKWKEMNPADKMDTRVLCALRKDAHGDISTEKHTDKYHYAPMGR